MKTKHSIQIFVLTIVVHFPSNEVYAQCETWHGLAETENLENSYVLYRDHLKKGEFDKAFPYWKRVYHNSPAADGKRSKVYSDGRKLYTEKFQKEKRKKKKSEIAGIIFRLLEEEKRCYPECEIVLPPKEIKDFRSEIK